MRKKILVIIMLFPFTVSALDCSRINPELLTDCSAIIETNLNQTEKDEVIRALIHALYN